MPQVEKYKAHPQYLWSESCTSIQSLYDTYDTVTVSGNPLVKTIGGREALYFDGASSIKIEPIPEWKQLSQGGVLADQGSHGVSFWIYPQITGNPGWFVCPFGQDYGSSLAFCYDNDLYPVISVDDTRLEGFRATESMTLNRWNHVVMNRHAVWAGNTGADVLVEFEYYVNGVFAGRDDANPIATGNAPTQQRGTYGSTHDYLYLGRHGRTDTQGQAIPFQGYLKDIVTLNYDVFSASEALDIYESNLTTYSDEMYQYYGYSPYFNSQILKRAYKKHGQNDFLGAENLIKSLNVNDHPSIRAIKRKDTVNEAFPKDKRVGESLVYALQEAGLWPNVKRYIFPGQGSSHTNKLLTSVYDLVDPNENFTDGTYGAMSDCFYHPDGIGTPRNNANLCSSQSTYYTYNGPALTASLVTTEGHKYYNWYQVNGTKTATSGDTSRIGSIGEPYTVANNGWVTYSLEFVSISGNVVPYLAGDYTVGAFNNIYGNIWTKTVKNTEGVGRQLRFYLDLNAETDEINEKCYYRNLVINLGSYMGYIPTTLAADASLSVDMSDLGIDLDTDPYTILCKAKLLNNVSDLHSISFDMYSGNSDFLKGIIDIQHSLNTASLLKARFLNGSTTLWFINQSGVSLDFGGEGLAGEEFSVAIVGDGTKKCNFYLYKEGTVAPVETEYTRTEDFGNLLSVRTATLNGGSLLSNIVVLDTNISLSQFLALQALVEIYIYETSPEFFDNDTLSVTPDIIIDISCSYSDFDAVSVTTGEGTYLELGNSEELDLGDGINSLDLT